MKTPPPSSRSMRDLRDLTPARVGLGRAGASMPTKALLEFTLYHARARDAVHAAVDGDEIGHAVVASGGRVALGDEIGRILGVRMIVMLIGERPGLSAPDSLGAYLTFAPRPGLTDAERNCVSNIHRSGLGYDEAAFRIAWLIREGLAREVTGVALKDESGGRTPRHIIPNSGRHDKSET